MNSIAVRCHVCGKFFYITSVNKDYRKYALNANLPYNCDKCGSQIESEARQEKYYKAVHTEQSA